MGNKYIPNLSAVTTPLRELTRDKVKYSSPNEALDSVSVTTMSVPFSYFSVTL